MDEKFFGSVSDASRTQRAQAYDGKFVHSFRKSSGGWLAANWLAWTDPDKTADTGDEVLLDSDVIYNTMYKWDTTVSLSGSSGSSFVYDPLKRYVDLQTVALHELGHNVGLDDIYNKPDLWWDETEVMNDYHWGKPKLTLGEGDKNGLKAIYGS